MNRSIWISWQSSSRETRQPAGRGSPNPSLDPLSHPPPSSSAILRTPPPPNAPSPLPLTLRCHSSSKTPPSLPTTPSQEHSKSWIDLLAAAAAAAVLIGNPGSGLSTRTINRSTLWYDSVAFRPNLIPIPFLGRARIQAPERVGRGRRVTPRPPTPKSLPSAR